MAGHDADLDFVGRDHARTVGPEQKRVRLAHPVPGLDHVAHRNALGDADHQVQARIDRLVDRRRGKRRRHVDDADGRAGRLFRLAHRPEDRDALEILAGLFRIHPGDEAVLAVGVIAAHPRVELSRLAGDSLRDHLGILVDQDAHLFVAPAQAGAQLGLLRNLIVEILPIRIHLLDQIHFPVAPPFFNLLFSGYCCDDRFMTLEPDQARNSMLRSKTGHAMRSVLPCPAQQVVCDSHVQRAIGLASKNIYVTSRFAHRALPDALVRQPWAPACAGATKFGYLPFAAATTFSAALAMLSALMMGKPDSARIFLPSSSLVPFMRTTSGTLSCTSRAAAITPLAIVSHFMMPPKILTRMAFRPGFFSMILNASVTFSAVAPPPTSRKFAGSPPNSLMVSMVAMAR